MAGLSYEGAKKLYGYAFDNWRDVVGMTKKKANQYLGAVIVGGWKGSKKAKKRTSNPSMKPITKWIKVKAFRKLASGAIQILK